MEKNTKAIVIVLVIVLILGAVGIAYVFFRGNSKDDSNNSDVVTDTNLEVGYLEASIENDDHGTVKINETDSSKINADVKLLYSGDGCYISATIENRGNVSAKLKQFNLYNRATSTAFTDEDIEVLLPDISGVSEKILKPGDTTDVTFTVKWKSNSDKSMADAKFDIQVECEEVKE